MLLNETRGSHGMYSRAGRNTTEKFQILLKKDEILNGNRKKFQTKNLYTPDYNYNKKDDLQDEIEIFNIDKIDNKDNVEVRLKSKIQKKGVKKEKTALEEFLEMKKNKRKVFENPSCTKYNPKTEFLKNRTIVGPSWNLAPPRFYKRRRVLRKKNNISDDNLYSIVEKEPDDVNFYLSHTNFKIDGKNFVDLKRQTKRREFVDCKNETDGFNLKSANPKTNRSSSSGRLKKWKKVQAPDFRKTMSRDQLDKVYGDKRTVIPFSFPNFKWTRPRPIMMVKYDQTIHKRDLNNMRNFKAEVIYNPQNLEKLSKYERTKTVNLDKMVGRPDGNDSLPCYMRQVYSRQSSEMMTDKALKMNNFSEGKFNYTENSFWPKKTFNKIINLNILNSASMSDYLYGKEAKDENKENDEINKYIQKSMKFYNKNFDELVKDSMIKRFDNVTYKTIKKENKLDQEELDKFVINFDKIDI